MYPAASTPCDDTTENTTTTHTHKLDREESTHIDVSGVDIDYG